jgi:hypothetical protein
MFCLIPWNAHSKPTCRILNQIYVYAVSIKFNSVFILWWCAMCWVARVQFPEVRVFLFSVMSRPTLQSIQHPIQSVPWAISVTVSSRRTKLITHLHLEVRSSTVELCFHFPIRLHGVVINQLSTGTTSSSFTFILWFSWLSPTGKNT